MRRSVLRLWARELRAFALIGPALLLSACFDHVETPFPEGLEPWEENVLPERAPGEPCEEAMTFENRRWMGDLSVHGRACVRAPLAETFAAVRHPCAGADRRPVVDFCFVQGTDPDHDYSHRSFFDVHGEIAPVYFELDWRHEVLDGSLERPTRAVSRWQKTDGVALISRLEGSIVMTEAPDGFTDLEIQYHLNTPISDHDTLRDYFDDYLASVVALVRGAPLPEQEGPAHGMCADPPGECPYTIPQESP